MRKPIASPQPSVELSDSPDAPRQRSARAGAHRPIRSFRAIGAFVLVLAAVGGGYVAVGHPGSTDDRLSLDVDLAAVPSLTGTPTPDVDPSQQLVLSEAQAKAAQAAVDAANQAKLADEAAKRRAAEEEASRSQARATTPAKAPTVNYPVPGSCGEYSGTRAVGCAVLLEKGFGLDQMPCLDKLWTKESHWNPLAHNASSGAHGIPQAKPGNKMAGYGPDWETNPVVQVKWGLDYIKGRYKTPCAAWAHSQSSGWY